MACSISSSAQISAHCFPTGLKSSLSSSSPCICILLSWHSLSPGLTPGLRWGPYITQMTYLQVQLDGRATVVFLKTLRCPVWGQSPVYSFHKCLHDKILVSSLHDWEVCGLLKVYSIGIVESKSSLPLFPDYWHRWMVLLNYVYTQWYSRSVPRHCPLNTHTFFCLFVCFLRWSIWQPWWSQTGTGPELAAILQPIPLPSATILGSCSL